MQLLEEEKVSLEEEIDFLNHLANALLLAIRIVRSSIEGQKHDIGPLTLKSLEEFFSNLVDVLRSASITSGRYPAKIIEEISKEKGKTLDEINVEWYYLAIDILSIFKETKLSREELQKLKKKLEEKLFDVEKLYSEKWSKLPL